MNSNNVVTMSGFLEEFVDTWGLGEYIHGRDDGLILMQDFASIGVSFALRFHLSLRDPNNAANEFMDFLRDINQKIVDSASMATVMNPLKDQISKLELEKELLQKELAHYKPYYQRAYELQHGKPYEPQFS